MTSCHPKALGQRSEYTTASKADKSHAMISIVTGDPRPIFKQIVDGFRLLIIGGDMREGDKLPSVRALALQVAVNANTVAKAYTELTQQGLIESRPGLGLFVASRRQVLNDDERHHRLTQAATEFARTTLGLDFSAKDILKAAEAALEQQKIPNHAPTAAGQSPDPEEKKV